VGNDHVVAFLDELADLLCGCVYVPHLLFSGAFLVGLLDRVAAEGNQYSFRHCGYLKWDKTPMGVFSLKQLLFLPRRKVTNA
jgi:hypothetical protein